MSETLQNKIDDDANYDIIEAAGEILSDKLYGIACQVYMQLYPNGIMLADDYRIIKKAILKQLEDD